MTRADIDSERIQFDRSEVAEVRFVSIERFQDIFLDPSSGYVQGYENEWRDVVFFRQLVCSLRFGQTLALYQSDRMML